MIEKAGDLTGISALAPRVLFNTGQFLPGAPRKRSSHP